jgi:hypothetical protein
MRLIEQDSRRTYACTGGKDGRDPCCELYGGAHSPHIGPDSSANRIGATGILRQDLDSLASTREAAAPRTIRINVRVRTEGGAFRN